jgi:hypothetical protein
MLYNFQGFSFSCWDFLAIGPLALHLPGVLIDHATDAMLLAVFPKTYVSSTVRPTELTSAFLLIFQVAPYMTF